VLVPIDESGVMLPGFGPAEGLSSDEAADVIIEDLRRASSSSTPGSITHRYPTCWRCGTPLVFRVVDDWFIACDEIRQPMLDANATVQWTPDFYSKRMDDWLRNMGDWNISRKRYFGLPLPFYPCDCGELNVIGSRAELEERATGGVDQARRSCTAPGSTRSRSRARRAARTCTASRGRRRLARRGHRPVLDARLEQPGLDRARLRHGALLRACPERTCPTTPTGSTGFPRTGSPRCASRSGSGSTRSRSCR
jgi:valyl-tRNA synthetase